MKGFDREWTTPSSESIDPNGDQGHVIVIVARRQAAPNHRTGVRIGPEAGKVVLEKNGFRGFARDVEDQRKK